jgi:hypothetical protein
MYILYLPIIDLIYLSLMSFLLSSSQEENNTVSPSQFFLPPLFRISLSLFSLYCLLLSPSLSFVSPFLPLFLYPIFFPSSLSPFFFMPFPTLSLTVFSPSLFRLSLSPSYFITGRR